MFRTFRQLALILAITIISSLAVMLLVSFVRDIRSHGDLQAPDIAFTLTPDRGKAAIFIEYGSSAPIARVQGTPAYKDFILRQNTSFATSDRSSDLQSRVSQPWSLNERLYAQKSTTEDIDKVVLRDLKAAVEAYLHHFISSVKVAFQGHENNKDYRAHIIAGTVRQIGLVTVWAGPPRFPRLAVLRKWLDEADFGKPESLVLIIDNSEHGFYLALAYNDDDVMDTIRHKYHDYTGNENPSDKASLFQQALEEIIKSPLNYVSYVEYARPSLIKRSFPPRNNTGISEEGSQQEHSESSFQVQSTCEDDPLNPLNWSRPARAKNILIICFLVFTQCWAGSAISMGNSAASEEFGVSQVAENLATAMFLFGVGTGALFAGPISETVGRNLTYSVATAFYLCFLVGSAMTPTFGGQVVCRFFVGLSASATLTINGASVNDQFRPVKRALVFPIVAWANVAAPVIAPIASGWIVSNPNLGWRWAEWITLMISGAAFVVALLFLPETYFPLILSWKAKELRRVTGDQRYISQHEQKHSFWKQMRETLPLPATFFRSEPVIIVLGLYLVLLYILLFSFLSGFDYIFKETYKLKLGYQGSCFAAIAAGATAFVLCGPGLYEWARQHTERVRGASIQPEFRLWPAIVTAPFLPIALFWLGWTNDSTISIWNGLGACFLFGIVLTSIYVSSYEYITDSYGEHSAIALGSITMSRYLIAGGMAMAARPMVHCNVAYASATFVLEVRSSAKAQKSIRNH
ncbi:major facilitator family transporter [Fusarium denticulatum]|uniref:Major facilitator family transporter n=1 Tax=Fusarium denticulatum TaxID=48507 RepID=A0A8H5XJY6_9HYPO|nr:major facilitator family transporter [Fusarium denticulatum]